MENRQLREGLFQYRIKYFSSKLFALEVPQHSYLDFLFVSEILVIVHFPGQEGISLEAYSFIEQKITSTPTKSNALDGTL